MKTLTTILVLSLLCACSSPPTAINYYQLHTPVKQAKTAPAEILLNKSIVLDKIELADYLHQSNLVMQIGQHELYFSQQNVWAEALRPAFQEALLHDLNQSVFATYITVFSPYATKVSDNLKIKLEHFHATDAASVVTSGKYWINMNDGQLSEHRFYFELPLEQDGYPHSVKKLRQLVTLIAKQIAQHVEAQISHPNH